MYPPFRIVAVPAMLPAGDHRSQPGPAGGVPSLGGAASERDRAGGRREPGCDAGTPRVSIFLQTARRRRLLVVIEMQRFDSTLGEAAQLDTSWTATGTKDGKMQMGRTTMREPVAAPDFEGLGRCAQPRARSSEPGRGGRRAVARPLGVVARTGAATGRLSAPYSA